MNKIELAQTMVRDAKAFYKRFTAGSRPSEDEVNLMSSFGVFLHNQNTAPALNEADALRSMLADADSIRIPTDNDGHFTTVNKVAGQGTMTKHLAGKWQVGPNYDEVYFDTALEAYAAIKPNAAAGEEEQDGK
jgi:hypothetical protein